MATPQIELTEWETTLQRSIRAYQPGLHVETLEESRAMLSIVRVAQHMATQRLGVRDITRWSCASTVFMPLKNPNEPEISPEPQSLYEAVKTFLDKKDSNEKDYLPGILILADVKPVLDADPGLVRVLREAVATIKAKAMRKTIIVLGDEFTLPPEIRADFSRIPFKIPSTQFLFDVFKRFVDSVQASEQYAHIKPSKETLMAFARACTGLSESEARGLLSLAIAKFNNIDDDAVVMAQKEKAKAILEGNALTMLEASITMDKVGGMEQVKAWAERVRRILVDSEAAEQYGAGRPAGLLLVGVPGCGKSYICQALAHSWQLPLLRFEVGSAFGSLVGESEKNIRRMQEMAEALKPCVVMIDEIEKALGSDSNDGGTTARVKGSLLTWLQEKSTEIFVVATANDVTKFNQQPEMIRAGRFDAKFFVDLPDAKTRLEVFQIHLRKRGHELDDAALAPAVKATKNYSPAEIEVIVKDAINEAFCADPRPETVTPELLVQAARLNTPLYNTMKESITRLRDWCKEGRARRAGLTTEDDLAREPEPDTGDPSDILAGLQSGKK